MSVNILEK